MSELKSDEWICPVCETINAGSTCFICGTVKPQDETVQASKTEINDNHSAAKPTETKDENAANDSQTEDTYTKNSYMLLFFGIIIFIIVMCSLFFKIFEYNAYLYEESCSFYTNISIISLISISDDSNLNYCNMQQRR